MRGFSAEGAYGRLSGEVDPDFAAVADAFRTNFEDRDELGAALCVIRDGKVVANLWGGFADADRQTPWQRDTMTVVFSATKGVTAICAHMLVEEGALDLDAPVADLWPEFAQAGKDGTTLRMMLDHSASVPAFREKLKAGGVYDWEYMTARVAAEPAYWPPGTRSGYHGTTYSWTVGEMIRRAAGMSVGRFFRERIGDPQGLDFWIGLPEAEEGRVAPVIPYRHPANAPLPPFLQAVLHDRASVAANFVYNSGSLLGGAINSREAHAAEIPAANGIGTAAALARIYSALAQGGGDLLRPETVTRMSQVSTATERDATLEMPTRFALGFMVSMDNRSRVPFDGHSAILGRGAFGHVGAGGSIGFADPDHGIAVGYAMNRLGEGLLLNGRGQSLVDAVYRSLGCRSSDGGAWV